MFSRLFRSFLIRMGPLIGKLGNQIGSILPYSFPAVIYCPWKLVPSSLRRSNYHGKKENKTSKKPLWNLFYISNSEGSENNQKDEISGNSNLNDKKTHLNLELKWTGIILWPFMLQLVLKFVLIIFKRETSFHGIFV